MKHIRILLVFAALLCLAVPAFAQEEFGLSADDTAVLNTAIDNSANAASFSYDFTVTLTTSGLGEGSDLAMDLTGSGVIDAANEGFSMAVEGSISAEGEEIPAALEVRVIGDTLYLNIGGQWFMSTVDELTSMAGATGALPVDPSTLMEGDMGDLAGMEGMGELMSGLASLDPTTFVSMSRMDDMGGEAHFQTAIDMAALLSNPAFGQIFAMAAAQGGADTSQMTPEQMEMMTQMMGAMFADAVFTFDQYVDTANQTVSGATLTLDIPLEGMVGTPGAGLNLVFDIDLSGYNEAVTLETPENAQPLSEMMGAMMGSM